MLEALATADPERDALPLPYAVIRDEHRDAWTVDWAPTLAGLLTDRARGESPARLARRFHRSLAQAIREVAVAVGIETVDPVPSPSGITPPCNWPTAGAAA